MNHMKREREERKGEREKYAMELNCKQTGDSKSSDQHHSLSTSIFPFKLISILSKSLYCNSSNSANIAPNAIK